MIRNASRRTSTNTRRTHRSFVGSFVGTLVFGILVLSHSAMAQNQWDISPYDVRVWIVPDGSAEVDAWKSRLPNQVAEELMLRCGAGWQVAATIIEHPSLSKIENASLATITAIDAEAIKADKIFLVQLNKAAANVAISVSEFDCNTQRNGNVVESSILQSDRLVGQITETILETFSPIGMVGRSKDGAVIIRMRSGLLDVAKQTPITPSDGDLLNVVLRKSDRLGNPLPNGIETVAWTALLAGPQPEEDSLLLPPGAIYCQIVSGLRNPIRSRGSRRVERFAIVTKPRLDATTLKLVDRQDTNKPLAGYDVYQRLPGEKTTAFVGRSNWQGELAIERDENTLRTFYIKNGSRMLARLPIVVGTVPMVTAQLTDDSLRLEAEGFVKSIQEEVVDLVARRKILALRVRKRIEDNKLDAAESLLDELRQLETRQDIERRIREREANFQTRDKAQQDRINRLFRDTRSLLSKHLSSRDIDSLRDELADARRGAPGS